MRLGRIQKALENKKITFTYHEEDGCGSIDFLFRGLNYHIWEFLDGEWGVETNLYHAGHHEDIMGDYEEKLSKEIESWPDM